MADPITLGAIGLGASGQLGNIYAQHKANQANKELAKAQAGWNLDMQREQNQWNYAMWNRSNVYNTPQAQMERFKKAGLNPHLIYGKGSPGNTSPMQSASAKPYTRADIKSVTGGQNVFKDIYGFQNMQAQTNNIKALEQLNEQKAIHEVAKTLETGENVISKTRGNKLGEATLQYDFEKVKYDSINSFYDYQNKKKDLEYKTDSMESRLAKSEWDAAQSKSKTMNLRANTKESQARKDLTNAKTAYQNWVNRLAKQGLTPQDDQFFRMMENDPDLAPYLTAARSADKGIKTFSQFLNFYGIFAKGFPKVKPTKPGGIPKPQGHKIQPPKTWR